MRAFILAPLAALLLALAACKRPVEPPKPQIKFETRKFERSLDGCGDTSKRPEPCVTFHVQWVEMTQPEAGDAKDAINRAVASSLQPADAPQGLEAEAAALIDDYKEFKTEFPTSALGYFIRRAAAVESVTPLSISISVNSEEFLGGAHPNSSRRYLNLRRRDGSPLALADIIRPAAMPALLALVEAAFRSERGLAPETSLADAGLTFDLNRFALPKQWAIVPAGLVFHYNPLEAAPVEAGPTTVLLPWSQLKPLLREDAAPLAGR